MVLKKSIENIQKETILKKQILTFSHFDDLLKVY